MEKQHDWFAALLKNPDVTSLEEFVTLDITADNSEIKNKDFYKGKKEVIDAFSQDGYFDEQKFNKFYKNAVDTYNYLDNNNVQKNILSLYSFDESDIFAPKNSKVKNTAPTITRINNNDGTTLGLTGFNEIGNNPKFSAAEIAQMNYVYDFETGEKLDFTAESTGGVLKGLFSDTYVLAAYDEDGEHEFNGKMVKHKKGEYKFDKEGKTYYETLAGRDVSGKQVLSYWDTLTNEGSTFNKYDFFDSDGLDKSVIGTTAKLITKVAPMFIPGVGKTYGAISAAAAVIQLAPVLVKSINGIIGLETGKHWNNIEGYMNRYDNTMSENSATSMFTYEGIANILESSSLQLFQQKVIGELPMLINKLRGAEQTLGTIMLGQKLSLAYMAGTSARETYSQFKEAGASDRVAGLGMIASMGAMYGLMSNDYFKDMLFKGSSLSTEDIKKVSKGLATNFRGGFEILETASEKESAKAVNKVMKFFETKVIEKAKNIAKFGTVNRSFNEAIEEVSEEVSFDMVKAVFKGANALGIPMSDKEKELDFGFSLEDMWSRYSQSFFGGLFGGMVFDMHGKWETYRKNRSNILAGGNKDSEDNSANYDANSEIIYLAAQGKLGAVRAELKKAHKKGKLGSTNLSAKLAVDPDKNGDFKFLSATEGDSQNDVIFEQLNDYLDRIENFMEAEDLAITDSKLESIVKEFEKIDAYSHIDGSTDAGKNAFKKSYISYRLLKGGLNSNVFQDFNSTATALMQTTAKLNALKNPAPGESADPTSTAAREAIDNKTIEKLEIQRATQRAILDEILQGKRNDYYVGQHLFTLDEALNRHLVDLSFETYVKINYGKSLASLTETEQLIAHDNYEEFKALEGKDRLFKAYDVYMSSSERLSSTFLNLVGKLKDSKAKNDIIEEVNINSKDLMESQLELDGIENQLNALSIKSVSVPLTKEEIDIVNKLEARKVDLTADVNKLVKNFKFLISSKFKNDDQISRVIPEDLNKLETFDDYKIALKNYAKSILRTTEAINDNKEIADEGHLDVNHLTSMFLDLMVKENKDYVDVKVTEIADGTAGDRQGKFHPEFVSDESLAAKVGAFLASTDNPFFEEVSDMFYEVGAVNHIFEAVTGEFFEPIKTLLTKVNEYESSLRTNPLQSDNAYKELIKYINEQIEVLKSIEDIDIDRVNKAHQALLDIINLNNLGLNINDFITEYNNVRAGTVTSPAFDLLDQYSALITGEEIKLSTLIRDEIFGFESSDKLENYVIENQSALEEMKYLLDVISKVEGLVVGATLRDNSEGFNNFINKYRSTLGKELLSEIDLHTSEILLNDLAKIKQKVLSLIAFSESNNNKKLLENKEIALNVKTRILNRLVGSDPIAQELRDELQKKFNININEIWAKHSSSMPSEITLDNFSTIEKTISDFETDLFKEFAGTIPTDVEHSTYGYNASLTAENLVSLFNVDELYKQVTTEFTPDVEVISDYDMLMYLATTFVLNSNNFNNKLKDTVDTHFKGMAPIFSQEYAIKLGYAFANNKELFNAIHNELQTAKEVTTDSYLSNKPRLNNFYVVYGGAGTGKTTAVSYLNRMIGGENVASVVMAPSDTQAEKLKDSLKFDDSVGNRTISKSTFLTEVVGTTDVNGELNESHIPLNSDLKLTGVELITVDKGGKLFIFVDEVTWFTEAELTLIQKWSESTRKDVTIFATGDPYQNAVGQKVKMSDGSIKTQPSGIEDTIHIRSPRLTTTMRSGTIAKLNNEKVLSKPLGEIWNEYQNDPTLSFNTLDINAAKKLKVNPITLTYYQDEHSFTGEQIIEASTLENQVTSLLKLVKDRSKIVIITDDETKYSLNPFYKGIIIKDPETVQGGEFDYVIIDKKLNGGAFFKLRDIYTLTQRSVKGSLIINNDTVKALNINQVSDSKVNSTIELDKDQIANFTEWRMDSLNQFKDDGGDMFNPVAQELAKVTVTTTGGGAPPAPVKPVIPPAPVKPVIPPVKPEPVKPEPVKPVIKPEPVEAEVSTKKTSTTYNTTFEKLLDSFYGESDQWKSILGGNMEIHGDESDIGEALKQWHKEAIKLTGWFFKSNFDKLSDDDKNAWVIKLQNKLIDNLDSNKKLKIDSDSRRVILETFINFVKSNKLSYEILREGKNTILYVTDGSSKVPLLHLHPETPVGKYNGEIHLVAGPSIVKQEEGKEKERKKLGQTVTDNTNLNFHSRVLIVAKPEGIALDDDTTRFYEDNKGKAFVVFSDNPFVDVNNELKPEVKPTIKSTSTGTGKITYLLKGKDKLGLMGVQRSVTFTELIELAIARQNTIVARTGENTNDNYVSQTHIINNTRMGELNMGLLDVYKNLNDADDLKLKNQLESYFIRSLLNHTYKSEDDNTDTYGIHGLGTIVGNNLYRLTNVNGKLIIQHYENKNTKGTPKWEYNKLIEYTFKKEDLMSKLFEFIEIVKSWHEGVPITNISEYYVRTTTFINIDGVKVPVNDNMNPKNPNEQLKLLIGALGGKNIFWKDPKNEGYYTIGNVWKEDFKAATGNISNLLRLIAEKFKNNIYLQDVATDESLTSILRYARNSWSHIDKDGNAITDISLSGEQGYLSLEFNQYETDVLEFNGSVFGINNEKIEPIKPEPPKPIKPEFEITEGATEGLESKEGDKEPEPPKPIKPKPKVKTPEKTTEGLESKEGEKVEGDEGGKKSKEGSTGDGTRKLTLEDGDLTDSLSDEEKLKLINDHITNDVNPQLVRLGMPKMPTYYAIWTSIKEVLESACSDYLDEYHLRNSPIISTPRVFNGKIVIVENYNISKQFAELRFRNHEVTTFPDVHNLFIKEFIPFSVKSKDGVIRNFAFKMKDTYTNGGRDHEIISFNSIDSYNKLFSIFVGDNVTIVNGYKVKYKTYGDLAKMQADLIENSGPNAYAYVVALLRNRSVTENVVTAAINELDSNPRAAELKNVIMSHLMDKIKNNEC